MTKKSAWLNGALLSALCLTLGASLPVQALSGNALERLDRIVGQIRTSAQTVPAGQAVALSARATPNAERPTLGPPAPQMPGICAAQLEAPGNGRILWAIYMIATDLESGGEFATTNLMQLVEGWRTTPGVERIDLLLAFGGANKDGWHGIKYTDMAGLLADAEDGIFGNSGTYLFRDETADMGAQATFEAFLRFVDQYQGGASQRFLSFWNHGSSYNRLPGIGPDELSRNILDLGKISHGLHNTDSCYHLVGFDACLMASLQAARALNHRAYFMIASEELEPGHGWNYADMLRALAQGPDIVNAGIAMVDAFVQDERHPYVSTGKTLSLIDLREIDALAAEMDRIGWWLAANLPAGQARPAIDAFAGVGRFAGRFTIDPDVVPPQASIDLLDFINLLWSFTPADQRPAELFEPFFAQFERTRIHHRQDGSRPYSFGLAVAPLDLPLSKARTQIDLGWIGPGWGDLILAWNELQESVLEPPFVLALHAEIDGDGLRILDRRERTVLPPEDNPWASSRGLLVEFASPWINEVKGSFGYFDAEDSFVILGELPSGETDTGAWFSAYWNGAAMQLLDGDHPLPVPLFLDDGAGHEPIHAGILSIEADAERHPEIFQIADLWIISIEIDEQSGEWVHALSPIQELDNGGWLLGRTINEPLVPGLVLTFFSLKVLPDGEFDLAVLDPHTLSHTPNIVHRPLRGNRVAQTLAAYTIADSGAVADLLPITDFDRVANFFADTYPRMTLDAGSMLVDGFYSRCNTGRQSCIALNGGQLWTRWSGRQRPLGSTADWLQRAIGSGY